MEGSNTRSFLKRLYNPGRWFKVSRDLIAAFSLEEAVVLSYLCNVACQWEDGASKDNTKLRRRARAVLGDDWFRCSLRKMTLNLRISVRVHDRIMGSLQRRGVIKRKQVGVPAARFIWIDYEKMDALVSAALDQELASRQLSRPPNGGP